MGLVQQSVTVIDPETASTVSYVVCLTSLDSMLRKWQG